MLKIFLPILFFCLFSVTLSAQTIKQRGPLFSKEEQIHFYQYKSRQQRNKAIVSLVGGPVLMVAGALVSIGDNGGASSANAQAGYIICGAGFLTSIHSLVLFNYSIQNNRKAKLLLKSEDTGLYMLKRSNDIPALGVQLSF